MSTVPISNLPPRKSFAQVAASAHKPATASKGPSQNGSTSKTEDKEAHKQDRDYHIQVVRSPPLEKPGAKADLLSQGTLVKGAATNLSDVVNDTHIASSENGQLQIDGLPRRDYSDTKSVASRTTLTLDEKESLRPDDSASVQAAIEEDSPAGSRVGSTSDPDARAFRDQLHEIERNGPARYVAQRNIQPVLPRSAQQSSSTSFVELPVPRAQAPTLIDPEAQREVGVPPPTYDLPPDEKLLEALASPKDRLFVLKIEQDMIDFVKDSKENFLQLPQTNSFYRMLSHKLADYYCLSHVVDESLTSVRIYRTPHCRLPPPLIGPDPATGGSTPPPSAPARKIMRRGDTDELGFPESGTGTRNSKTTSELDGSGSDDNQKDKAAMTREERENRYKEARARIFKDFKEGSAGASEIATPSNEADHSRSSSRSGLRQSKTKKSRKPRDDTFEARSAYSQVPNQQFIPHHYQQGLQGSLYNSFANLNVSGPYAATSLGAYQQTIPSYRDASMAPQHVMQNGQWYPQPYQQQYPPAQGMSTPGHFTPQTDSNLSGSFQGFQPYQSPNQATPKLSAPPLAHVGQAYQQPQAQAQNWGQTQYQQPYGMQPMYYGLQPGGSSMHAGGQVSFAYPGSHNDMQFQGQHNRHFNPNSQSFVPGMPGMQMIQGPQFQFVPQQPQQQPQQQQYGNESGQRFAMPMMPNNMMQRQPSNHSQASGFGPTGQQQQQQYLHQQQNSSRNNHHLQQQQHQSQSADIAGPGNSTASRQQHLQQASTISKWANAAGLPSKPPAPASSLAFQVPPNSMGKQPLPQNPLIASNNASRASSAAPGDSSGT